MRSSQTKRRSAAIVTAALVLATAAAPASARTFDYNTHGSFVQQQAANTHPRLSATVNLCSEACSANSYGSPRGVNGQLPQATPAGTPSPPHIASPSMPAATQTQTRTAISPLLLAAQSAETLRRDANLGPRENANPITAAAAIKKQAQQIAAAKAAPRARAATPPNTPFQWGDAAIGAAGMLLLLTAASVAILASRRWHYRATAS
jgi:hypothetical protein